jgi:hypothetical protein
MPNYSDILKFLASNPPQTEAEQRLHASLLELLASCLRSDEVVEVGHEHVLRRASSADARAN